MPSVTFPPGAERTGNKFIQYLTCKLIGHLFGHTYGEVVNPVSVTESEFARILQEKPYYLCFVDIQISGLFQRSEFFVPYRQVLLDIVYDPGNTDFWIVNGEPVFVRDLLADVPVIGSEADLFMSVRLDDFLHYPWHSKTDIPYPSYYKDILRKSTFRNLYIICDTVKQEWEWKYLEEFAEWKPILLQESFAHDCCLMRTCKRLIHSNSTLCWVMSFLTRGEKERFIPNTRHYEAQTLEAIEESDSVFYPETMTHEEMGCKV